EPALRRGGYRLRVRRVAALDRSASGGSERACAPVVAQAETGPAVISGKRRPRPHVLDVTKPAFRPRAGKQLKECAMAWHPVTATVTVKDGERALVMRDGRFERVLAPGRHRLFDPLNRLTVELFNVVRTEFAAERYAVVKA